MRRLLLALFLGLVAAPSHAGDMYYRMVGSSDIRAVSDNGGVSRVVLKSTEYQAGSLFEMAMTRYNHLGSNGQALYQSYSPSSSADAPYDLQLVYRDPSGVVVTKQVSTLGGKQPRPRVWHSLAQDDSFFSFVASDDATGRYSLWRLNVTVDQALATGYVPPSDYNDPRLQLVVDQVGPAMHHTWSPDGSRLAYRCSMTQSDGTRKDFVRLKSLIDGSDQVLGDWISDVSSGFMWGPTGDLIVAGNGLGDVWAYHADTPGVRTLLAPARTYKSGKDTITEQARAPRFRPDGGVIGISYYKSVSNKFGNPVYRYPAVMAPTGWPAQPLLSSAIVNDCIPLGWTP